MANFYEHVISFITRLSSFSNLVNNIAETEAIADKLDTSVFGRFNAFLSFSSYHKPSIDD